MVAGGLAAIRDERITGDTLSVDPATIEVRPAPQVGPVNLGRLQRADVAALIAALAVLALMAADWYSTVHAEEARRVEEFTVPQGGLGGEVERTVDRAARERAESASATRGRRTARSTGSSSWCCWRPTRWL